jgi:hypothetical protein
VKNWASRLTPIRLREITDAISRDQRPKPPALQFRECRGPPTEHGGGPGPVRWWDRPMRSHEEAPRTPGPSERMTGYFNLGTVVGPAPRGAGRRRRRTWTHSSIGGFRSKGAHAVEFSKTAAPLRKGLPSFGGAQHAVSRGWDWTDEYSAHSDHRGKPRRDSGWGSDRAGMVAARCRHRGLGGAGAARLGGRRAAAGGFSGDRLEPARVQRVRDPGRAVARGASKLFQPPINSCEPGMAGGTGRARSRRQP